MTTDEKPDKKPLELPYQSIAKTAEHEIEPIKGSRFIAFATAVTDDDQAMRFIAQIKQRFPDARHCCWAYQLREQQKTRFSDDGEPNGSAGKPILAPIVGQNLQDVLVVVVRYFGGVKLGVGGLVRAYSQAANAVLKQGEIITITPTLILRLVYAYEDSSRVAAALANLELQEDNATYTAHVESTVAVVPAQVEQVIKQLTDYTAGKIGLHLDQ